MPVQSLTYYVDGVLNKDRRILAKAITLLESSHPVHRKISSELVEALQPHTGRAVRLGITGVPGVGKSTFIESFGSMLTRKGQKVAVLAVDPSSKRSGGSIMADKTRMEGLSADPKAFIRPSPSGATLGGVARKTRETMLVCEAAGFDVVIVETVGVGQSETTVAGMVDFFLVLMLTGAGDALQGIKKGILELADAVAINKADADNIERAEKTRTELENAMHLLQPASDSWAPPVVTCSSMTMAGLEHIWELVQEHHRRLSQTSELSSRRKSQALQWMWSLIEEGLQERFHRHARVRRQIPDIVASVKNGDMVATTAARKLLFLLDNEEPDSKL
jgi:LAO/AO transport system kinase